MNAIVVSTRSNPLGFLHALVPLLVVAATGTLTLCLWRAELWVLFAVSLVIHGNICSLLVAGVHELSHGTVFSTRWLNKAFAQFYGFLVWIDMRDYMKDHAEHHRHTLQHNDAERPAACRVLWIGSWVWVSTFNLPYFFSAVCRARPWILGGHFALLGVFASVEPRLILLVTVAPFCFGWLELLLNYAQHAGMKTDTDDITLSTRSLRLPGWLSFLFWRMEYHVEHHLWPHVPCYKLPELRVALEGSLPPRQTLWQAWRQILSKRREGECGHGKNPVSRFLESNPWEYD